MTQRDDLKKIYLALIEAIELAKKEANPELEKALRLWAESVASKARLKLSRPSWLLTSSISEKVVDYQKTGKLWAIAGFEKTSGGKRTPGSYGQYHEAGWAPDRKIVKVPKKFLKQSKQEQTPALKKDVDDALANVVELIENTLKKGGK